jgi:putative membrane protein
MDPLPYCGAPPVPGLLWTRWNTDPALLAALAAVAFAHLRTAPRRAPGLAAWALLAILFVSPFCALTSALFAARTLHHILLVGIVPPLLLLAGLRLPRLPALPAALLHFAILWAWHLPAAYALALSSTPAYWLMQASLLASALALWRAILPPGAAFPALAALAFTTAQTGLLGALLTFIPVPLYAFHHATTWPWGLSPLADQHLAGALMWTLGALPTLVAAAALAAQRLARPQAAAS